MRLIAEFIMRGRSQAVLVALMGVFIPVLTQAAIGLVTLRKGWQEGLLIMLWGLLPALGAYWVGQAGLPISFASIAVVMVSFVCAVVLRKTTSWPATLSMAIALSCMGALIAIYAFGGVVAQNIEFIETLLNNMEPEVRQELQAIMTSRWYGGMIGFGLAVSAIICLMVSRWWQALLYNPGGFREEFHGLRLNSALALASIFAVAYCEIRGKEYGSWALMFALPMVVAGLGLVHCVAAKFKSGVAIIVVSYFSLLFIPPIALLVFSIAGLTDVWLNYRKRFNLMQ